jgi:hypothetical protein
MPSSSNPPLAPKIPLPFPALAISFPLQLEIPSICVFDQLPQQAHFGPDGTMFCKDTFEDVYIVDMDVK